MLYPQTNCVTIRQKYLAGYNLLWNFASGEVHYTGAPCGSSDHLDRIALPHEHFFLGRYTSGPLGLQLHILRWDPATAFHSPIKYDNCAFCKPELRAR